VRIKVDGLGQKITLSVVDKIENDTIKFGAEGIPMEANFWIQLKEVSPADTRIKLTLKADIPMMFKLIIGKKIQTDNELVLQYLTELLRGFRARGIQDKVTELAVNSIANISFDFDGRFTVNYGEGGGTAKLDRLVEVIGRLEEDARGTLEVAADGSIHYIPV
jgi:hypothetical protein